jgi:hypothetical protein
MDKGKTTQIRGILERGKRLLILTHQHTLAADIHANCKGTTKLMHYVTDFPNKEAKMYMGAANQLICHLESIHHLCGS